MATVKRACKCNMDGCESCQKAERSRRYYLANKARINATNRAYYAANRGRLNEANKRRGTTPEGSAAAVLRAKRWAAAHPERAAALWKKWRDNNKARIKEWAKDRRAKKKGAIISDFTAAQWKAIQEAFDYRCAYCDKRHTGKGELTQDHIVPLSKGGAHTAANIVPACGPCNSKKHTGPPLKPIQPPLLLP